MKNIAKLNSRLFLIFLMIIVGCIIAFCVILPMSTSALVENKIYSRIIEYQKSIDINSVEKYSMEFGIYNVLYTELDETINTETNEEILHHKLMYKEFFQELKMHILETEETISTYKYAQENEKIFCVVNKSNKENVLISYKIDNSSHIYSHQVYANVCIIIVITLTIISLIFLKWSERLINNLKDIQHSLDRIGEGNLQEPIQITNYTEELQEVMHSLERMRQRLYENEQVKQGMIHNISHDLKTPLAVIKNYAEGIIDSVYPYGTVEETAHVIYNQADRLQKRVQGLLYLNRLDYIKSQKEIPDSFEMKALVLEVVEYMQDREDDKHIITELDESLFVGDIEKWRIVLENLIDNAKRYAEDEIIIKVIEGELGIYNNGQPIEDNLVGSLFKPFEVGQGGVTGLGLAIVKKTVELYGYSIKFVNAEEIGVTFSIAYEDKA